MAIYDADGIGITQQAFNDILRRQDALATRNWELEAELGRRQHEIDSLKGMVKCYLQEEDAPEDHDISRLSAVCGRCYSALDDMHKATIARLESALTAAWSDIGQWIQLAERQREVLPNPDQQPSCPTTSGIDRSREVRAEITKALQFAKRL